MADSGKSTSMEETKEQKPASFGDSEELNSPPPVSYSPKQYRRLIWKLDMRLLPPLIALWAVSLIDRVNIGNARIQGLEKDLHMDPSGTQFNVALIVIYAGLLTCEIPSNWLMRKIRPSIVLCSETFLLGIFIIAEGTVNSFGALTAMRVMIGIFEAGLIPGSIYLLSHYYPRYELQWRMSMLILGNALSNAFGGLLALGIANIHSANGYSGWRWIFIIEGCLTVAVTTIAYFAMTDWPETCKWLNEEEKQVLASRIRSDGGVGRMDRLDSMAIKRMCLDWKVYLCSVIYAGTVITLYSITIFAPTIISQFSPGKSATYVQALVIPIFVASAVATLSIAYISDKIKHRGSFAIIGFCITGTGLLILINQNAVSANTKYGALYLMSIGAYISMPLVWTMLANNVSGAYKTAFAVGVETSLGSVGGVISAWIFKGSEAPLYTSGYKINFGAVCIVGFLTVVLMGGFWLENRARDAGKRDHRLEAPDADNLGDDHPNFRFTY